MHFQCNCTGRRSGDDHQNTHEQWKAIIRKRGWPTTSKTHHTNNDAEDRARRTEDEMVREVYINGAGAEKLLEERYFY